MNNNLVISRDRIHILSNQKFDIEKWIIPSLLFVLKPLFTLIEIKKIVSNIIHYNDALTLSIDLENENYVINPINTVLNDCIIVYNDNNTIENKRIQLNNLRNKTTNPFTFVIYIDKNQIVTHFQFFIAHYISDRKSMINLTNQIFKNILNVKNGLIDNEIINKPSFIKTFNSFNEIYFSYVPNKFLLHIDYGLNSDTKVSKIEYTFNSNDFLVEFYLEFNCNIEQFIVSEIIKSFKYNYRLREFSFDFTTHERDTNNIDMVGWISKTKNKSIDFRSNNKYITESILSFDNNNIHTDIINIIHKNSNSIEYNDLLLCKPINMNIDYYGSRSKRIYKLGFGIIIDSNSIIIQCDYSNYNQHKIGIDSLITTINNSINYILSNKFNFISKRT